MGAIADALRAEASELEAFGWSCNLNAHSKQADRLNELADQIEELEN